MWLLGARPSLCPPFRAPAIPGFSVTGRKRSSDDALGCVLGASCQAQPVCHMTVNPRRPGIRPPESLIGENTE
jgi:hypothetical protein